MQSAETKTFHLNVFLNKCLRKHEGRENTSGGEMLLSGRGLVLKAFIVSKIPTGEMGRSRVLLFSKAQEFPGASFFFFFFSFRAVPGGS